MRDCHDTHCCIVHSCKYCDPDCPVHNGIRKQVYLCEDCYNDSEYSTDLTARTLKEQEEHIEAVWNEKHNPKELTSLEQAVKQLAEKHGYKNVLTILEDFGKLPFTRDHMDIQVFTAIDILKTMKEIP